MVPVKDLSGLTSSAWALARAPARAAIDSLELCMVALHAEKVEAHRPRFRPLGSNSVSNCLLGILWHEGFKFCLGNLVFDIGGPRAAKDASEFGPGIG